MLGNEGQTAHLPTVLLHRYRPVRTQIRTARRGSIPFPWSLPIECHKGLAELARRRSDLFTASSESRLAMDRLVVERHAGFMLTWRGSKGLPRTNTAHRMRAFLLASATAAFCQPAFSRSA